MKKALFILIPIIAFIWAPLFIEEFETSKVIALITFSCFSFFWTDFKPLKNDAVAQSLALFTVSAALSTLFSIDWHMSVFGNIKCRAGLLVFVSYLIFYLAAVKSINAYRIAIQMIDTLILCAGLVSVYAIAQVLGYDFRTWNNTLLSAGYTRPMSTLGHPNFMAGYLAMILPYCVWRIETSNDLFQKVPRGTILLFSITAIALSLSRGMCIAAIVSMSVYFILTKAKFPKLRLYAGIPGIIVVLALVILPSFRHTAIDRAQSLLSPGPARTEYPLAAIRMWKTAPFLGIGTDTYEIGFRNRRTPIYWQVEPAGSPHKAHNDFLNILATQGLFGALASIILTLMVALQCLNSKRSMFFAPAVASIVAFYIEGLTSFTVVATGTLFLLSIVFLKAKEN
jgi:hypothetical protein